MGLSFLIAKLLYWDLYVNKSGLEYEGRNVKGKFQKTPNFQGLSSPLTWMASNTALWTVTSQSPNKLIHFHCHFQMQVYW